MTVEFKFDKKFVLNGKEYDSIDDVPAEMRGAIKEALASKSGMSRDTSVSVSTEINFAGKKYDSVASMPFDVRKRYREIMSAVSDGKVSKEEAAKIEKLIAFATEDDPALGRTKTYSPIEAKATVSGRTIIIAIVIIVVALLAYLRA